MRVWSPVRVHALPAISVSVYYILFSAPEFCRNEAPATGKSFFCTKSQSVKKKSTHTAYDTSGGGHHYATNAAQLQMLCVCCFVGTTLSYIRQLCV